MEKIRKAFRIIAWLLGFSIIIQFTGCRTVPVADLDSLEYQRRIAALEARIVDYESRLRQYDSLVGGTVERLEVIRGRANSITDRIDRIIFLFEEYDREVNRLINSFNNSGGSISQIEKDEFLAMVLDYCNVVIETCAYNSGFCETVYQ